MGWLSKLFGTGSKPDAKATCVRIGGGYIIDLRPLPPNVDRALSAIAGITEQIERAPEPFQVWVVSTPLLDAFSESTDLVMKLTDALYGATKSVQPKIIVEQDAPEFAVFILRSLGFEVYLPGLKLSMVDAKGHASELDPIEQLEKLRRAPRVQLTT